MTTQRNIASKLIKALEDNGHFSLNNIKNSTSSVSTYFGSSIRVSDHAVNRVGVPYNILNVCSDGLGDVNIQDYELNELVSLLIEFDTKYWDDEYFEGKLDECDIDDSNLRYDILKEEMFSQ